jgi:hypothetical protein
MVESTTGSEHDERASGPDHSSEGVRGSRWTRTRVIWLLIILSLSPGFVAAAFRDQWQQLPPGVHWSAYIFSAMLIVTACTLMLTSSDEQGSERASTPASPSEP